MVLCPKSPLPVDHKFPNGKKTEIRRKKEKREKKVVGLYFIGGGGGEGEKEGVAEPGHTHANVERPGYSGVNEDSSVVKKTRVFFYIPFQSLPLVVIRRAATQAAAEGVATVAG